MNPQLPSELQLDALREMANIGCGHAANALSRLVGGRVVHIDVPRVVVTGTPDAALLADEEGGPAVCVVLDVTGEMSGRMMLVWPEADARALVSLLVRTPGAGAAALLEEPGRSALEEAGNIVASSCLAAVSSLTRLAAMPSVPRLSRVTVAEAVGALLGESAGERAVVLEARFRATHVPPLTGRLLLVPDRATLPRLFSALGLPTGA